MRGRTSLLALTPVEAGGYRAEVRDDADLGATRELTIALSGALELTLRTNDAGAQAVGDSLRVEIAAADISVWAIAPNASGAAARPA